MPQLKQSLIAFYRSPFFTLTILVIVILMLYLPYILNGGFIIDDWGIVTSSHDLGVTDLVSNFKSWFPLFSNRPLVPIFISFTGILFDLNPLGYIITTLILWFLALSLIGYTLKNYLGVRFSILFIALASVPIIASTVIFSPGMQITATASYLFYSLALWSLHEFLLTSKKRFYLLTYIFVITALLIYEITLPLLPLLFFLPYFKKENFILSKKYFIKYGLPLILVIAIIFLYQRMIIPHFMPVWSRFNPATNPFMIIIISVKWIYATFIVPLILGLRALNSFYRQTIPLLSSIPIFALWIIFIFSWIKSRNDDQNIKNKIKILTIFILTLLASLVLLLLANSSPNTTGYDNRGLSVTWIALSLILAYIGSISKNKITILLILIITGLSWLAFIAERNSYIDSYRLQIIIAKDIIKKAKEIPIPTGATIISNVSQNVPGSFNQEDLFNNPWDFGGVLNLYSNKYITDGNTLTNKKINLNFIEIKDDQIMIDGYWTTDYKNLWFYDYNHQKIASSSLQNIKNKSDMTRVITSIQTNYLMEEQTWDQKIYECLRIKKRSNEISLPSIISCF